MKKSGVLVLCILIILVSSASALAASNITKQDAEYCLNISRQSMDELSDNNFTVQKINDTLRIALDVFSAQEIQKTADYSFVISSCNEIVDTKALAYESKDLLYTLEKDYSSFKEKVAKYKVDTSSIDSMMDTARQDFQSERYAEFKEELSEIESKMTESEASATTLNLFYNTTVTTLGSFILANYIVLLSILAVLLVSFFIYRFELRKIMIQKKIKNLKLEKKVLKRLIQKSQKDYFTKGSLSEAAYHIRLRRFVEMVRDIDRQVPLLEEELAKVEHLGKKELEKFHIHSR
jgi:hypothetical protein